MINPKVVGCNILCLTSLLLLLTGCKDAEVEPYWEGVWERRVFVPEQLQGRCYDEVLSINKRRWELTAIIHSTYECDQPFLELGFEGSLDEVQIKRNRDHRDVTLIISDIYLASMTNVTAGARTDLSMEAVERLSDKYVPEQWQSFEQKLRFDKRKRLMSSVLFAPVVAVAVPEAVNHSRSIVYKR